VKLEIFSSSSSSSSSQHWTGATRGGIQFKKTGWLVTEIVNEVDGSRFESFRMKTFFQKSFVGRCGRKKRDETARTNSRTYLFVCYFTSVIR
jgi:hypothetical protein